MSETRHPDPGPVPAELPPDLREGILRLKERFPQGQSVLLPALHAVQAVFGHVPERLEVPLAALLDLPPERVRETVTFYSMFNRTPVGRHQLFVCGNISCWLRGAESVREYLERRLEIRVGETTPDGRFTLTAVECLGMCDHAPVMLADGRFHGGLTPEKIDAVLNSLS